MNQGSLEVRDNRTFHYDTLFKLCRGVDATYLTMSISVIRIPQR